MADAAQAASRDAPTTGRPGWMTALAIGCFAAALVNVARDLFVASSRDVEIWLGFEIHGLAAMLTAPLHWLIFALGGWAFWTCQRWIVPAAAAYAFYAGISHLIWSEMSAHGRGWPIGLAQALVFSVIGLMLLRARPRSAHPA